jgi:murein DD-endopeptidase MepM/ murein hydrolase activator NlpD
MSSRYGGKRMFNGEMKSFHQGLDLRAGVDTPVIAPERGRVVLAQDLFFTGNTLIFDHGMGLFSIYAHLNHLKVKVGDEVQKEQLIALSGKTGRASGPHLHWGIVIHSQKVDPETLIHELQQITWGS